MVRFDQDLETHYAPIDEDHQRLVALLEAFIATIDKRQRVLALKALNAVAAAKKLRLIILDACRDNPFEDSFVSTGSGALTLLAALTAGLFMWRKGRSA